jgi:long-chain acyl-CoA synthetase
MERRSMLDTARGVTVDRLAADIPGERTAVVSEGGTLHYSEFVGAVNHMAEVLCARGIERDECVAVIVPRSPELVVAIHAIMRAGAAYMPIDPDCPPLRIRTLIEESSAHVLVAGAEYAELADELGVGRIEPSTAEGGPFEPVAAPADLAYVIYTSGSTGRPKGAIMTHRGMLWYVAYNQRYWPSSESDRGLVALPLFHKNALRGTVKPMLYAGGSFVLMPGYEPRAYLDALARYRCTYSRGVAAVFTMLLQHRDALATLDLSALRGMTIGSAVVAPELMDAVERALPHVKVSESYGLTEGGSPLRPPIDGRPVPRGSPGVAAPEVELRLVDAQGRDADEGELLIRCPYVCLGYHNEPEITRAKLTDGWLRTGDVFRRDKDGFFYFRSRIDDMFSCGGENIYPKEVENLLFAHPDVVNAVVAPVPHPVKGFVPAAMVIARAGSKVTAEELKAYCLDKGPAYSHPRYVDIVDALPLNGAGKIDRGLVQARLGAARAAHGAREGLLSENPSERGA